MVKKIQLFSFLLLLFTTSVGQKAVLVLTGPAVKDQAA